MTIRVIVQVEDWSQMVHVGGTLNTSYRTYDIEAEELERYVYDKTDGLESRRIIGVELITTKDKDYQFMNKPPPGFMVYWRYKKDVPSPWLFGYVTYTNICDLVRMGSYNGDDTHGTVVSVSEIEWKYYGN